MPYHQIRRQPTRLAPVLPSNILFCSSEEEENSTYCCATLQPKTFTSLPGFFVSRVASARPSLHPPIHPSCSCHSHSLYHKRNATPTYPSSPSRAPIRPSSFIDYWSYPFVPAANFPTLPSALSTLYVVFCHTAVVYLDASKMYHSSNICPWGSLLSLQPLDSATIARYRD